MGRIDPKLIQTGEESLIKIIKFRGQTSLVKNHYHKFVVYEDNSVEIEEVLFNGVFASCPKSIPVKATDEQPKIAQENIHEKQPTFPPVWNPGNPSGFLSLLDIIFMILLTDPCFLKSSINGWNQNMFKP